MGRLEVAVLDGDVEVWGARVVVLHIAVRRDKDGEEASQRLLQFPDAGIFGIVGLADFFGVFLDGGDEALGEAFEGFFVAVSQGEGDECRLGRDRQGEGAYWKGSLMEGFGGASGRLGLYMDSVVGHFLVVYGAVEVFAEAVVE